MSANSSPAPGCIEILERAAFLLREQPASAWAVLLMGQGPLLVAALRLCFDALSAVSESRYAADAVVCAACFLWFNVCRARFSRLLFRALSGGTPDSWARAADPGNLALQSVKLFAMPAAAIALVPMPWLTAFFRTRNVLAGSGAGGVSKIAGAWQRQNVAILLILSLAGLMAFLNFFVLVAMLPELVRMATGMENGFTRLGLSAIGTALTVSIGLTWMALDPLYEAVYCVRAFLIESRQTGLDLMCALRRLAPAIAIAILLAPYVKAQPAGGKVTPAEMRQSIEKVLKGAEYDWRLPRARNSAPGFIEQAIAPIKSAFRKLGDWFDDLMRKMFPPNAMPSQRGQKPPPVAWIVVALVCVCAAAVGIVAVRVTRSRGRESAAPAPAVVQAVKLEDEHVSPAALPEEGWLMLAQECSARGEYRLAMRALFLANVSFLGRRGLLTIGPSKSNRDYCQELRRRSRGSAVFEIFSAGVRVFERGWYGRHPVDAGIAGEFETIYQRVRGSVDA